jgi:hypothetical protein
MSEKPALPPETNIGETVPIESAEAVVSNRGQIPRPWWRVGDIVVLVAYSVTVVFAVRHHEKWADEAQAWLLARDVSLKTLWLHELRYEGSPGLWHTMLWIAQHWFGAGYASLGYIGAACAIAGAAWLIFRTPFPHPLRWLAAFSYFFLYQYAVVARSYVLFAFFALIIAERYRDRERPGLFALSLVPLALLTAHGSALAVGWGVAYGFRFLRTWHAHDEKTRRSFAYSLLGIGLLYLFLLAILLPAKDTEAAHNAVLTVRAITFKMLEGLSGALVDARWPSIAILVVFTLWSYLRRSLMPFLLPVGLLTALYVYAAAWPYQQGTIFCGLISGLAIAWPTDDEQRNFSSLARASYRVVVFIFASVLAYQAYLGFTIIRNDERLPYSGAEDAAQYLRPAVGQHKIIYGYQYGMVAINGYFPNNIFANWRTAYYHHALGEFDPRKIGSEIAAGRPDYVVTTWWEPFDPEAFRQRQLEPMASLGYSLVHLSDGYMLMKSGYFLRQIYAVYERSSAPGGVAVGNLPHQ